MPKMTSKQLRAAVIRELVSGRYGESEALKSALSIAKNSPGAPPTPVGPKPPLKPRRSY